MIIDRILMNQFNASEIDGDASSGGTAEEAPILITEETANDPLNGPYDRVTIALVGIAIGMAEAKGFGFDPLNSPTGDLRADAIEVIEYAVTGAGPFYDWYTRPKDLEGLPGALIDDGSNHK